MLAQARSMGAVLHELVECVNDKLAVAHDQRGMVVGAYYVEKRFESSTVRALRWSAEGVRHIVRRVIGIEYTPASPGQFSASTVLA